MRTARFRFTTLLASLMLVGATSAGAQTPASAPGSTNPSTVCGLPIPAPAALPPAGSLPVIYQIVPCFAAQGNTSTVEAETYLYYIHLRPSLPSQGRWVPYDDAAEALIKEDFARLWATNFLDDLDIQVSDPAGTPNATLLDYVFNNGVVGGGAAVIADGHGHGELRNSAVISPVVTRQYAVVSDSGGNVPF